MVVDVMNTTEFLSMFEQILFNMTQKAVNATWEITPRPSRPVVLERICAPSALHLIDGYLMSFESLVNLFEWMRLWVGDPYDPSYLRTSDRELFLFLDKSHDSRLDQCELGYASGWVQSNSSIGFTHFQSIRSQISNIVPRRGSGKGCQFAGDERAEVYDHTGLRWEAVLDLDRISGLWWNLATVQRQVQDAVWDLEERNSEASVQELFTLPCTE